MACPGWLGIYDAAMHTASRRTKSRDTDTITRPWKAAPTAPARHRLPNPTMICLLAGLSLLLGSGCESSHHSDRSHRPTPLPPTSPAPRPPIPPAAWRTEANRWLGVKYRRGGTDRGGIDCSGLVSRIYLDVAGISLARTAEHQFHEGTPVSPKEPRPGDLIFFSSNRREADHVGLCLGGQEFVHASPSKGVVISSMRQDYYATRLLGVKRIIH